jgi:hypothetical protein
MIVAFGFAALDTLGRATDGALSLDEVMDLRDNATALSAAGHQCQTMLDRSHKQVQAESAGRKRRTSGDTGPQQAVHIGQDVSGGGTMH